jgi:hypothetical protein
MAVPTMKEIAAEMFSIVTQRWINEASTHTLKDALGLTKKLLDVLEGDRQPTPLEKAITDLNEAMRLRYPSNEKSPLVESPQCVLSVEEDLGIVREEVKQAVAPSVPEPVPTIKRRATRSDKGIKRAVKRAEEVVEAPREIGDVF